MATISTSGISPQQIIRSEHLLRIIEALNGTAPNDVIITGNLSNGSGLTSTNNSHAEGYYTTASGQYSHAEGDRTIATGSYSHTEGSSTTAIGSGSHAEGIGSTSSGNYSHAEGSATIAVGAYSHTEGIGTSTSGQGSHAEGYYSFAATRCHAEGYFTTASANGAHSEGYYTVASGPYQHVQGQYNISSSDQSAFIIGNGTADNSRSNLIFASGSEVQVTGSLSVSGTLRVGPTIVLGTPTFGIAPQAILAFSSSTIGGGTLDLRNTSTDIAAGEFLGTIQFSGKDDNAIAYSMAQIRATVTTNPTSGNSGGGNLKFYTATPSTGAIPVERMSISSAGVVDITGSLLVTGSAYIGTSVQSGTAPIEGIRPTVIIGEDTGGVLDIRSSSGSVNIGQKLGTIQFTGKDDASNGYTMAKIEAITDISPSTGTTGASTLKFYTSYYGSPIERMAISSSGLISIAGDLNMSTTDATLNLTSTIAGSSTINLTSNSTGGGDAVINTTTDLGASGDLVLKTANTERIRIKGSTAAVTIDNILTLVPTSSLPTGQPTGSFIVSGSGADCKPYFYNGTTWTALF